MPTLERRISLRGPRFWLDDGALMFANQLDGSTRDGPRAATDEDKAAHPSALAMVETVTADPPGRPLVTAIDPAQPRKRAR
jgi:hypothetical protein